MDYVVYSTDVMYINLYDIYVSYPYIPSAQYRFATWYVYVFKK